MLLKIGRGQQLTLHEPIPGQIRVLPPSKDKAQLIRMDAWLFRLLARSSHARTPALIRCNAHAGSTAIGKSSVGATAATRAVERNAAGEEVL